MNDEVADTLPDRPKRIPWPAIALMLGIVALAIGVSAVFSGNAAIAAVPGAVAGLFGAVLSPRRSLPWPLIAAGGCVLLLVLSPGPLVMFAILVGMSSIAGVEAALTGGRSGVLALFMVVALHLIPAMPEPGLSAVPALLALALTWGITQFTPLAGTSVQAPSSVGFGVSLAVFLASGLTIASFAMHLIDDRFAHWLALLFVMRGLAKPGEVVQSALRFGLGTIIGSVIGLIALALSLPQAAMLVLAFVALLAGFRLAPDPGPWSPAAFSSAVLFLTSPSPQDALFRIEAAIFAVLLSTVLMTLFAVVWALLDRPRRVA